MTVVIYQLWTFDEVDRLFYGPDRVISTLYQVHIESISLYHVYRKRYWPN